MKQCMYWKKSDPEVHFTSGEHIFPAGIGGKQTLPLEYVCTECNTAFSALEKTFMRDSLIAIPRQFYGPGKRGSSNPKKATKSNVCLMRIKPDSGFVNLGYISVGNPYYIPQLKISKKGALDFTTDPSLGDPAKQVADFTQDLEKFTGKYSLLRNVDLSKDEFVIGYHKKKWYVTLSNPELEQDINPLIEKVIKQKPLEDKEAQSSKSFATVNQTVQFDEGYYRVCAKILLNYLAFSKGHAFVLHERFDPIREWIVNGGENRFATLMGKAVDFPIAFPKNAHKLMISMVGHSLVGFISFYEGHDTQVELCEDFTEYFEADGFICDWKNKKEYRVLDYILTNYND